MIKHMDGFTNKALLLSNEQHLKSLIKSSQIKQELDNEKELNFFEENKGKKCKILFTKFKGTVYNLVRNDSKQYLSDKYMFQVLIDDGVDVPTIMEFPLNVIEVIL